MSNNTLLAGKFVHGVYIPSALLIAGTAIIKIEWVPYAVALALAIGSYKIFASAHLSPPKSLVRDELNEFPLIERIEVNYNTSIYRFALPSPDHILGLPIGQHVVLSIENKNYDENDKTKGPKLITRSYTPITDDTTPGYVEFLIKHYETGAMTQYLKSLQIGQTIRMRGPEGRMNYTPKYADHLLMVAGGSGITPMLQVIKAIVRNKRDNTKIDLVFANAGLEDILLKDDLDRIAQQPDSNVRVHYVLEKPPVGWEGYQGFVTDEILKQCLAQSAGESSKGIPDNSRILLCGPLRMVGALKKVAAAIGYEKDRIFAF